MTRYRAMAATIMTPREFLEELAYPASSGSTLVALVTFVLLITLAEWAGLLGLWLMVVTVPAFLRYLTMIAIPGGGGGTGGMTVKVPVPVIQSPEALV